MVLQTKSFTKQSLRKLRSSFVLPNTLRELLYLRGISDGGVRPRVSKTWIWKLLTVSQTVILKYFVVLDWLCQLPLLTAFLKGSLGLDALQPLITNDYASGRAYPFHVPPTNLNSIILLTTRPLSYDFAIAYPTDLAVALYSERHASEKLTWLANLNYDFLTLIFDFEKIWVLYCSFVLVLKPIR